MFLKFNFLILVTFLNQTTLAQERIVVPIEVPGPFIVCSAAHFVHKTCPGFRFAPDYVLKDCPICRDNNLVEVRDIRFDLNKKEACAICCKKFIPKSFFDKSGLAK